MQPPDRDGLPEFLVREVPGFAESPELQAVEDGRTSPGVVTAALGRYLLRLQRRAVRQEADASEHAALDRAYVVLEELAASDDPQIQKVLSVEIFEPLHSDDVVVAAVETRLGPRSSALYRRWAV